MSSKLKPKCFIIQPLDDAYKKRCDDTYKPAIRKAGLLPDRLDEDCEITKLKIQVIQGKIKASHVCLADITEDNPNVWYEVGFADGHNIPVVLICEQGKRENLPFDINQRNVCFYDTTFQGDWEKLRREITKRIKIACESIDKKNPSEKNGKSAAKTKSNENKFGKPEYFILWALNYAIHGDPLWKEWGNEQRLREKMGKDFGFDRMQITNAITRLKEAEMIKEHLPFIFTVGDAVKSRWLITDKGSNWCCDNEALLRSIENEK